ncbi:hypothetical protein HK101_010087 [Irineochytrium annulatum]|nr:hypothetical protein HK101_010087 [Irineochytrium annulatum]
MKAASPRCPILVILPPVISTTVAFGQATAAALLIIHFAFRFGCVGDVAADPSFIATGDGNDAASTTPTSMPYADSTIVFGLLTVHLSKYICYSVAAKNKYAVGPVFDSAVISLVAFAVLSGVWVSCKSMNPVSFIYAALLPGIVITNVFFAPLGFQWKNGDSLVANMTRSVMNAIFLVFFVELNLTAMVTMFIMANMHYKSLAGDGTNANSLSSWLYGTIMAFGAPFIKFFNVQLQQKVIGIWQTPERLTSKEEEANIHRAQIIYGMKDDVHWAVAANGLTLRSSLDSLFYISASESLAITLIQRIAMCLHFRWKRKREARRADIIDAEAVEVGKPAVVIRNAKHIEKAATFITAPVAVNEAGRLTSLIDITDAHTGNRGFAAEAFGAKKAISNLAKTAGTGLDVLQQPEIPFIPLDPAVKYGHAAIGVMTSETAGRLCAYIIIIALVTIPDASSWSSWAGPLTTAQTSVRLAFLLVGGTLVDAVAAAFEACYLGLDYRESVTHFTKVAGVSWSGFAFVFFSAVVTVAGYYIIADAGVVVEVAGYQRGRKF